ncbi:MAG: recombinase family protein [Rhizomicrobium sp.]
MGGGKLKEIDPIQGPLVRRAFELYASGEYNFHTLRAELNKSGLRTRTGKPISLDSLTHILNNPFYIGLIFIKKTKETFLGKHEPLISKNLFDQVQFQLRGNRLAGAAWTHEYTFRRMIRCAHCGRTLIGERQKQRYVYYRCHERACGGVCISEVAVDASYNKAFSMCVFSQDEVEDFRDMLAVLKAGQVEERKNHEEGLRLAIVRCDERLSRLTDALLDETLDKEQYQKKNAELLRERRALLDRMNEGAEARSLADLVAEYLEFSNTCEVQYSSGQVSEKRKAAVWATSNFTGSGKNPAITLKSPLQEALEYRISQSSALHPDDRRTRVKKLFDSRPASVRDRYPSRRRSHTSFRIHRPVLRRVYISPAW